MGDGYHGNDERRKVASEPSTLAELIVNELIYFSFIHAQAGNSLWVIRNESFFEVKILLLLAEIWLVLNWQNF